MIRLQFVRVPDQGPAVFDRTQIPTETETMMTKRAWMTAILTTLLLPIAGLRAADDGEKVEGDLKKLQGQVDRPLGQRRGQG